MVCHQRLLTREIERLAAQFDTLVSVLVERVCSAEGPTPRWLRTLAILTVDLEFLVSRRCDLDLAAITRVCEEVQRLLSQRSEDPELRHHFREACESFALVLAIAGEAERQSRRVGAIARLLGDGSTPKAVPARSP